MIVVLLKDNGWYSRKWTDISPGFKPGVVLQEGSFSFSTYSESDACTQSMLREKKIHLEGLPQV